MRKGNFPNVILKRLEKKKLYIDENEMEKDIIY
jgi:hypothetical protein